MSGRGVLLVGDVIDDVIVRPSGPIAADTDTPSRIDRVAGGSAANTACWLASTGVRASLIASVGAEDVARHAALLAAHGVVPHLRASARSTGTIVVLSVGDERTMLTDRGANEDTAPADVADGLLDDHAVLHVTGHVLTAADREDGWRRLFERAAARGTTVSVAPGSAGWLAASGPARFRALIAAADVVVASAAEARLLTGRGDPAAAAAALGLDHRLVVVTLGSEGSVIVEDGAVDVVPAVPATAVDVTGAGDAFAAGLLAGVAAGRPLREAAEDGARLAAIAVGSVGARPA